MTLWFQILATSLLGFQTPNDNYFEIIAATDTTSYIKWGNREVQRQTINAYPNWPTVERLSVKQENDQYILLKYWTGSDAWALLVLPLSETEKESEYWNDVAIDLENEIVVYEYNSRDTVLIAENIRSHKKQVIGLDWEPCSSAIPHYCIEDIEIVDKVLVLKWVVPNKLDDRATMRKKKVSLKI